MAQTKVSDLTALTTPDGAEELLINDGGTSKKITIANARVGGATGVDFNDGVYVRLGTSNDLRIYHDGSDSRIADFGDGDLILAGTSNIKLRSLSGEEYIICTADGAVTLYYDNSAKIATTAAGATVTGTLTADLADNSIDSEHYVDASIDNAHLADDAVGVAELSATGTASSTTFLRGDNTWDVPIGGVTSVNSVTGAVTAAHIATAVEAASDSNTFTDADHTKLNAIAASANNYVHPNHSGEVTSTADGATVIADNVVDEANLKVSNSPSNGYVLSAQSGNTGGLTWAEIATGNTTSNPMWEMAHTVSSNYTMTTNYNGVSVAPVTINSGVSVTVPTGSTWTIV